MYKRDVEENEKVLVNIINYEEMTQNLENICYILGMLIDQKQ
jgi:hypothetical protein